MRRHEESIARVYPVHEVIRHAKAGPIHRKRQPRRGPTPLGHLGHERAVRKHIEVIIAARCPGVDVPDPHVFITDGLQHDRALPVPVLVHAGVCSGACAPLPVGAVQTANTSWQAPLSVATHDAPQVLQGRRPQVLVLVCAQNKGHQPIGCQGDRRLAQRDILVAAVHALPICKNTKGANKLLQRVGLWPAGGVWSLLPPGLSLDGVVDTGEDNTRHTEAPLEVLLIVHGLLPVQSKVMLAYAPHRIRKVATFVAAPAGDGAPVPAINARPQDAQM